MGIKPHGRPKIWVSILLVLIGLAGTIRMVFSIEFVLWMLSDTAGEELDFFRKSLWIELVLVMIMFLLFVLLLAWGIRRIWQYCQYWKLSRIVGDKEMILLEEIAKEEGYSLEKASNILTQLIGRNYFPEGHLHEEGRCFFTTDQAYGAYQKTIESWKEEQERWIRKGYDEQEKQVLEEAQSCVKEIGDLLEDIRTVHNMKGQQAIAELENLKDSVEQLVAACSYDSDNLAQLRTFLSYYLPLAKKFLSEYRHVMDYHNGGEYLKALQKEIPEGLQILVSAFEKIADRLCNERELQIHEDLQLLEALMAQQDLLKEEKL